MLEDLIKELDQKGILVMQVLLGKRAIELLETEKHGKPKPLVNLLKG